MDPQNGPVVLIVEEDHGVRAMLGIALRTWGLKPLLAANGQEALDFCRERGTEITSALINVGASEQDGPQTLVQLRALKPDLPCCFATGGGAYSEAELLAMGVARVFTKPFALDHLLRTLKALAACGERRRSWRLTETHFKVAVADAASGLPVHEGWLLDRSRGGVSIRLPQALAVGSVWRYLLATEPDDAPAQEFEVRHCRQQEMDWLVGCQFVGH